MPQRAGAVLTKAEVNGEAIDPLYLAAVQAVEEAVVNAIVAGEDVADRRSPGERVIERQGVQPGDPEDGVHGRGLEDLHDRITDSPTRHRGLPFAVVPRDPGAVATV